MAKYRKVDSRIWNDEKFRQLSDSGKLVFFMLLTHPNMTALGAMRATLSGLAEEIGWETEAFRQAFGEALSKGMAEHDPKACLIALPNFIRYNPPESPNVVKAWISALDLLPECELKGRVVAGAKAYAEGMTEGFAKALPEAFAKSMPNQEQEQEPEPNKNTLVAGKHSAPACPHQQIIDLYHQILPTGTRVKIWNETRRRTLAARWREAERHQSLEFWERLFRHIARSPFLTSQIPPSTGRKIFVIALDWIINPTNFAKIIEGKYHAEVAQA